MPERTGYLDCLTPEQEKALEEFRLALLPAELKKHDDFESEDLQFWGATFVDLDTTYGVREKTILLKYLRARKFDVYFATKKFIKTLQWRKQMDIKKIMAETFPREFERMGCIYGESRQGHPVVYVLFGFLIPEIIFKDEEEETGEECTEKYLRWRVKLMERAIERLDFEKGIEEIVEVFDYQGASMMNMEQDRNTKESEKLVAEILGDHYPEYTAKKLYVNASFMLEKLYNFFSGMGSTEYDITKYALASHRNSRWALLDIIDPTSLPEKFGGFIVNKKRISEPVEKVYVSPWAQVTVNIPLPAGTKKVKIVFVCDFGDIKISADEDSAPRADHGELTLNADENDSVALTLDNRFSYWYGKTIFYCVLPQ